VALENACTFVYNLVKEVMVSFINRYTEELNVQIGKRNLQAPNQWELLDLDNLKFPKPTVICLSGNGALTNNQANKLAQQVETYLDLMFSSKDGNHALENIDIMSVKYAYCNITGAGILDELAIEQLAIAILELLVDKNGNKLNLADAKKNMSRLTFFTYCAGNKELQNIICNLNDKLALVGYNQNEIKAIDQATLEVSFAPLNYPLNFLPSVDILSLNDSLMAKYLYGGLGTMTKEQLNHLDGVYLHQTAPGPLFGLLGDIDTAASIQVLSTGLLNSYSEEIDEHAITITARDQDWNIRPTHLNGVAHRSNNADCVSQIMAWALCKGVENSIQNFQSQTYIPNTYWDELVDDFKSIIHSYGQDKLARNQNYMYKKRKSKFNRSRKKLFRFLPRTSIPTYQEMIDTLNNADSWETVITYLQNNNFFGIEHVLPEVQVLTQPEKASILKMAGQTDAAHIQEIGIEI